MKNKIRIGECILNYRKQHGLTQSEFGELLGVSAQAISKWERELCYPDIFLLPDISDLISISIDELMGRNVAFVSTKAVLVRKSRRTFRTHKPKAPPGGSWRRRRLRESAL